MINYSIGLKRPFQDLKKLLIGIIISIIPIVNLIAVGYSLRAANTVLKKKADYKLPEWNQFWDLFVKGISGAVIGILYALPALIIFIAIIGTAITDMISTNMLSTSDAFIQLFASNAGAIIIALILMIIAGVLTPLAVLNYVKYNKFSAAFNFKEVFSKINFNYIITFVLVAIYTGILTYILAYIPYIGTGIAYFIGMITMYTWYAEAYKG